VLLLLVVPVWLTSPAAAGWIFHRQAKPEPAKRVPALITTLKTDPDEKKRSAAAQELRSFDPAAFPDIIPVLIEAAQADPKAGVRMEAVNSLAKLRPVSQQVGQVLEQVVEKDTSMRVRLHARSLLVQYHLSGYRSPKNVEGPALGTPPGVKTEEPPLADPPVGVPGTAPVQQSGRLTPVPQPATGAPKPQGARRLPVGPTTEPPVVVSPSAPAEGPELGPAK
jgi:hypothetical protein